MMPGMNGQEMGRKMKAFRPDIPIILVSGYASGLEESSDGEVFSRILMKPVTIDLLSRVIGEILAPHAPNGGA